MDSVVIVSLVVASVRNFAIVLAVVTAAGTSGCTSR